MIRLLRDKDYDAWLLLAKEVEPLFGPMVLLEEFQKGIKYCIKNQDAYCIEIETSSIRGYNKTGSIGGYNETGSIGGYNETGSIESYNNAGSIGGYNNAGSIGGYNNAGSIESYNKTGSIENKEITGIIAGIIALDRVMNEIVWLAVGKHYRGHQYGNQLVKKAIDELQKNGPIFVRTFASGIREGQSARKIYEKFGFTDYKTEDKNPAGFETVVMIRE